MSLPGVDAARSNLRALLRRMKALPDGDKVRQIASAADYDGPGTLVITDWYAEPGNNIIWVPADEYAVYASAWDVAYTELRERDASFTRGSPLNGRVADKIPELEDSLRRLGSSFALYAVVGLAAGAAVAGLVWSARRKV